MKKDAVGFLAPEQRWTWRRVQKVKGKVHVSMAQRALPQAQRSKGVWLGETPGGGIVTFQGKFVYYARADKDGATRMKRVLRALTTPKIVNKLRNMGVI